jgi:Ca2+-binding RTX toxin-like protein
MSMTAWKTLILRRTWSVAAAGMLVTAFALVAPAGAQTPPTCGEETPTIVGTNGADLLVGTPGDDVIVGLGGRDVIVGKDGNDLLCGGRGGDLVSGNGGDDFVAGDDDALLALAEQGLATGDGGDVLFGNDGADFVWGCPAATSSTVGAATTS